jgi:3',5'-cyclic AMP phosphodiesterase CpdA
MVGSCLLHISDLHFGRAYTERMGEAVLAAADEIRPDAVLVSGDLVEWSESTPNWRQVSAFLARFKAPVLAVPGNHDIHRLNVVGRFVSPFRAYRRHVHDDVDRALALPGAHVVGVSSPSRWTVDLGYVSRTQAEWADDSFAAAAADALRVLVVHHGPRPAKAGRVLRTHLRGRWLGRLLAGTGVDLVLSGHRHFPHAEEMTGDDGAPLLWLQAGTATCWRINRETHSNSFTVIRSTAEQLHVGWWYYRDEATGFSVGEEQAFPRKRPAAARPSAVRMKSAVG